MLGDGLGTSYDHVRVMSALPPKADIRQCGGMSVRCQFAIFVALRYDTASANSTTQRKHTYNGTNGCDAELNLKLEPVRLHPT